MAALFFVLSSENMKNRSYHDYRRMIFFVYVDKKSTR